MQLLFVQLARADLPPGALTPVDERMVCFERFRALVLQNMNSQLNVGEYCDRLGIGERRLNQICPALMGESPLSYVHRQMAEEAKR